MIRHLLTVVMLAMSLPASAHGLLVFAFVEEGSIVVESKFSTGKLPTQGEVTVFDADDVLIKSLSVGDGGKTRIALEGLVVGDGLRIVVETGEGHSNYWILTPDDVQSAQ